MRRQEEQQAQQTQQADSLLHGQTEGLLHGQTHAAFVRITHAITALSFFTLLVSGIAILIAHPRLYWGETGAIGTPSLIDLPLPLKLGHSGWGRYLHFLSAWVVVFAGVVYVLRGVFSGHFRWKLLPARTDLSWSEISRVIASELRRETQEQDGYNVVQRLTYLAVVFGLFPLIVATGLAMSPSITSVFPWLVTGFGGQQSARTVHFFAASALVAFFAVHIAAICLAGFKQRVSTMLWGGGV